MTSAPPGTATTTLASLPSAAPSPRQVAAVGALSVAIIALLVAIATLGFQTLSSARAYVGGEGLWSKAQKDAVFHLLHYAYASDPAEYLAFRANLEVFRGDRAARIAALAEPPDWAGVRQGFIKGRNHPDDVHGMGVFLRRFERVSFVAEAIRIWETADEAMARLEQLGARVHADGIAGQLTGAVLAERLGQIEALALELGALEDGFSQAIGGGARWAARVLAATMVVIALLLVLLAALALRSASRRLHASESARRTIEAQLRQAQKMEAVGQLTGGIAHDFNNLLTVILANVRLIEARLPDDPALEADLNDLKRAAERGAEVIRKLLAFSRTGQITFEPRALEQVVPDMVRMLRRVLPETVRVETAFDPATPTVRTDPSAVEQMVLNLATNARDAMPGGGTLRLSVSPVVMDRAFVTRRGWGRPGRYAALRVKDTGAGIPPGALEHIFEPFFTTKPPGEGSGLGMAMVYGLMKQHGGFVEVATTPGQGTEVTLYFPAAAALPVAATPETPTPAPAGGTILLVEDEPAVRRAATRLLEHQGYRVLAASDGEEGLALAREHRGILDLILSDVVMPRMGGPAMHAALAREGFEVPFLFTSGYAGREMPDGIPLPAGVPLLPKPWDAQELVSWVARHVRRKAGRDG